MAIDPPAAASTDLPESLTVLAETFPDEVREVSCPHGEATARVAPDSLGRIMEFARDDSRLLFNVLVDITAVDFLGRDLRFELAYHLLSLPHNQRLRIKTALPATEPAIASVTPLWGSADWLEREVFDMFGIAFQGHPNLQRILLYPEFKGHPLRKDYPIRRRQPLIGPKN